MKKLIIISVIVVFACGKDENKPADTTKPTTKLLFTSPAYEEHDNEYHADVEAGNTFTINVKISDNQQLKQLKIDAHHNFDDHTHAHGRAELTKWTFNKIYELAGTEQTISPVLTIPTDAVAGPYHIDMHALDASGNEADFVEIALYISNIPEQASVTGLNVPAVITNGQVITLSGLTIADNKDLTGGKIEILFEDPNHKAIADKDIESADLKGVKSVVVQNFTFTVPANAASGIYHIYVWVKDADGNISDAEAEMRLN
ncbi:MAG: DUF4625 domain-containing protein [Cytophagales bacterium]|nr:DUF4625 domain-containing protein [Cytophagales bacterium]